jgi:hypothetical protein
MNRVEINVTTSERGAVSLHNACDIAEGLNISIEFNEKFMKGELVFGPIIAFARQEAEKFLRGKLLPQFFRSIDWQRYRYQLKPDKWPGKETRSRWILEKITIPDCYDADHLYFVQARVLAKMLTPRLKELETILNRSGKYPFEIVFAPTVGSNGICQCHWSLTKKEENHGEGSES